MMCEGTSL